MDFKPKASEKKLVAAVEQFMNEIRDSSRDLCVQCDLKYGDPLADVVIDRDPESGLVRMCFDGAGHSHFSYDSDERYLMADFAQEFGANYQDMLKQPTTRDRFDAMLKSVGWYAEDCNTWSLVFVFSHTPEKCEGVPNEPTKSDGARDGME